jgi:hypothetical protein
MLILAQIVWSGKHPLTAGRFKEPRGSRHGIPRAVDKFGGLSKNRIREDLVCGTTLCG